MNDRRLLIRGNANQKTGEPHLWHAEQQKSQPGILNSTQVPFKNKDKKDLFQSNKSWKNSTTVDLTMRNVTESPLGREKMTV